MWDRQARRQLNEPSLSKCPIPLALVAPITYLFFYSVRDLSRREQ